MKGEDRKSLVSKLKVAARSSIFANTPSVYDKADPELKMRLIGCCLHVNPRWLESHPRQAEWLVDQEISPAECLRRYREWSAQEKAKWRERDSLVRQRCDDSNDQRSTAEPAAEQPA